MKLPVSWLKDFVDLSGLEIVDIARILTMAGLEVEDISFAGLPLPKKDDHGFKVSGIEWDRDKLLVAEVSAVNPHPNADRLVLCDLFDGKEKHVVLTGAPNLFKYKGQGKLPKTLKVAFAKESAVVYNGHSDAIELLKIKKAVIRGVESSSMVCSEKELGISKDHEGIIIFDDDAPVGMPLADYIGDAVLDVKINPNMARNANVLGVARELAALTGRKLIKPNYNFDTSGASLYGMVKIDISQPELNPRFVLGLIRDVKIYPSPYWVQRRLRAAGMRPISNVVDATNYAMIEIGQPLHAFDYDVLEKRKGPQDKITILTRTASQGEKLVTLDNVERTLAPSNVLVCDTKGALSMAGIMGGLESEISGKTRNILLEGAAWNFINIRRTANQHNLPSEASFRFSRGVHPALAEEGLRRCLYWMSQWSGGKVAPGIVDEYPLAPKQSLVKISQKDIKRSLGIEIPLGKAKELLESLEFDCAFEGTETLLVKAPLFRMDIGEGIVGIADIMEELARLYGFENIPESLMADPLPPQRGNPSLEAENRVKDIMVALGLQEIISHRMTSPEIEQKLLPAGLRGELPEYVKLANFIAPEKRVMRRSMLSSVMNVMELNFRQKESLALFEIGSVYIPKAGALPLEPRRLAFAMSGKRTEAAWDSKPESNYDFFDIKGVIEALFAALHLNVKYVPSVHPSFHPGKCAAIDLDGSGLGVFGELHPELAEHYSGNAPVVAADLDLEAILAALPSGYPINAISEFPPILEDIALVVDEDMPADRVESLIKKSGGEKLVAARLFDVFRSEQLGKGKKSLAYALAYQSPDGTLNDKDAADIRNRIVAKAEKELGAKLRSS